MSCKKFYPTRNEMIIRASNLIEPKQSYTKLTDTIKKDLLEKATEIVSSNKYYLFSKDKEEDSASKLFSFLKYDKKNEMISLLSENNNLYEIIEPTKKCKLYFDLECGDDKEYDTIEYTPERIEIIFETFIENVIYILDIIFNIKYDRKDIIIMNSSRINKLSYHLIFNKIYFEKMSVLKSFIILVISFFNNSKLLGERAKNKYIDMFWMRKKVERRCIIDKNPYTSYQNLRCINQSKIQGKSTLKLESDNYDLLDTLVSHNFPENMTEIKLKDIEAIRKKYSKYFDETETTEEIKTEPKTPRKKTQTIKQTEDIIELKNCNWDGFKFGKNTLMNINKLTYGDLLKIPSYLRYLYLIPNENCDFNHFLQIGFAIKGAGGKKEDWLKWAQISKKFTVGSKINGFDKFKTDGQIFNLQSLKKIAKMAEPEYFNTTDELFNKFFSLNLDGIKVINEKSEFVSQKGTSDENNILDNVKFLILSAYLGRGKTTAVKRLIEEKKYTRFLFLSPRITFSMFITGEFEGIENTIIKTGEEFKDISKSQKLIVNIESIQKVNIKNNYECIFLDESESILNQYSSPTMAGKYLDHYNKMIDLINNAKQVVCADAFLTNRTINFIKSFNQPITLIKNDTPPVARKAERTTLEQIRKFIFKDINADKKPYICSSTSTDLRSIKQTLIDTDKYNDKDENKPLFYFGSVYREDKEMRETLEKINETWKKAKFIGTTPTNTCGCSYSIPDDFNNVYMMCNFPTCSVRDMFQMSMRVRHIKENKLVFCLPEKSRHKPKQDDTYFLTLENYENATKEKYQSYISIIDEFLKNEDKTNHGQLEAIRDNIKHYEETPAPLREILYFNLFEQYLSNTHYEKMYYLFLDKCGYSYLPYIENTDKDKKKEKQSLFISDEDDEKLLSNFTNIMNITKEEAEYIIEQEKKLNTTSEQKLKKEKFFFLKKISNNIDDLDKAKLFFNCWLKEYEKRKLIKAYEEKHKTIIEVLEKDLMNANKLRDKMRGEFIKLMIMTHFKNTLKLKSCFDTETIIKASDLNKLTKYILDNRKKLSILFNYEDKCGEDNFKTANIIFKKIFNNWSGLNLVIDKKNSNTKKAETYKFSGVDYYKHIIDRKPEEEIKFIDDDNEKMKEIKHNLIYDDFKWVPDDYDIDGWRLIMINKEKQNPFFNNYWLTHINEEERNKLLTDLIEKSQF